MSAGTGGAVVGESDPVAEPFYRSKAPSPGTCTSCSTGRELPLPRIATG